MLVSAACQVHNDFVCWSQHMLPALAYVGMLLKMCVLQLLCVLYDHGIISLFSGPVLGAL